MVPWQSECVQRLEDGGLDRRTALHEMLRLYADHMATNEPGAHLAVALTSAERRLTLHGYAGASGRQFHV